MDVSGNSDVTTSTVFDPLRYDTIDEHPNEVAGTLRRLMPGRVRVLDVGCGTGSLTLIVNRDKGNDVIGLEPDPTRADLARSRGLQVHEGELTPSFLETHGPFDVIMFADVLEHLNMPSETLAFAVQGLKPGGQILASVPNVAHWSVRLMLLTGRFDYAESGIMDATHLRWFTARTFVRLMRNAGLKVESMHQTAGTTLPVYCKLPLAVVPRQVRHPSVRALTKLLPKLFGCQHVVAARKPVTS